VDGTRFHGHVVWLTSDQGGRSSGPPTGAEYRVTGFVPPRTIEDGLASFWLVDFEPGAWRSPAVGWWLAVENVGAQEVRPGGVVVVTEGARTVAYFHVDEVRAIGA
jgi:hypothetical protein